MINVCDALANIVPLSLEKRVPAGAELKVPKPKNMLPCFAWHINIYRVYGAKL